MTADKSLKKLRRDELLEMLIAQSERVAELEAQVSELKTQLEERNIMLSKAGSIAEASLRLNRVFEHAEEAARDYLVNVKRLYERQQEAREQGKETVRERGAEGADLDDTEDWF